MAEPIVEVSEETNAATEPAGDTDAALETLMDDSEPGSGCLSPEQLANLTALAEQASLTEEKDEKEGDVFGAPKDAAAIEKLHEHKPSAVARVRFVLNTPVTYLANQIQ